MIILKWLLVVLVVFAAAAALALRFGQGREAARGERLLQALDAGGSQASPVVVDVAEWEALPAPVATYLRHVLAEDQRIIRRASFRQSGSLRTDTASDAWTDFSATQEVAPGAPGFVWDARVSLPLGAHIRVLDSYVQGIGSGRVSLMSAIPLANDFGLPALNAGALHRYLAEAVWYPTALLPGAGVAWTGIDDRSAMATLTDGATSVSLTFRFNDNAEVASVYTPGRYRRIGDGYRMQPWEARLGDYRERDGMRIPFYGEVGWYENGELRLVWKGHTLEANFAFAR